MRPSLAVSASLAVLLAGCATSQPMSSADWAPSCTDVGCLEPGLGDKAPVGTEMSFSQCRDGARYSYRFVREAGGWKLVFWEGASVEDCDPGQ